ncbi:MAG: glycosyltransferase [Clostridium perfringens]|nr:glycosyltransferase [Clostridium perfringens]
MNFKNLIKKCMKISNDSGFKVVLKKILKSIKYRIISSFNNNSYNYRKIYSLYYNELKDVINCEEYHSIIVFDSRVGWNIPLFQRPQHMAIKLSDKGFLYFYRTSELFDSNIKGMKKLKDRLYLVNMSNYILQNVLFDILKYSNKKKFLLLYSTDIFLNEEYIKDKYLNNGFNIVYEYIDELSSEISGELPDFIYERHKNILINKNNFILVTADKLMEDVIAIRGMNNVAMASNGVEYSHWQNQSERVPKKIKGILDTGNVIIGYFGALAKWIDYKLIKKIAEERPNYEIILIGFLYDNEFKKSGIEGMKNIHYLGVIDYKELPLYAKYFTVSIIPFLLNDITESTNPVKLFEYMALNKPIVTTDLRECRKYKSVLIGRNNNEFIKKLDYAININKNDKYYNYLKEEALENTWEKKAEIFYELINVKY